MAPRVSECSWGDADLVIRRHEDGYVTVRLNDAEVVLSPVDWQLFLSTCREAEAPDAEL